MKTEIFNGKKLTIAQMSAKDLKRARAYADFINSLITEDAKILMNEKQTLKKEIGFLKGAIKKVEEKKKFFLIAWDGDKIVANTSMELQTYKRNHIAKFGIAIRDGYRGGGLGTYIMGELMRLAKKELKPTPKIYQLEVYENNKPAIGLYKKMGFKIVGKIPKQIQHKGKLIGEYIMMRKA